MISEGKAKVTRNVLITSAGKYAEYFLALVSSVIVARGLGVDSYGVYAYIIYVCGWMIQISNISLPTTAIRFVAEARGRNQYKEAESVAGILLRHQTVSSLLVCGVFLTVIQFYRPEVLQGQGNLLFILICIAVFFKARYAFLISVAKGYERFDVEAVSAFSIGLVSTSLMLFLALTGGSLYEFFLVFTVSCMLMTVAATYLCKSRSVSYVKASIESSQLKKIHHYRRITMILGLTGLLGGHVVEIFLLGQYGTNEQIGFLGLSIALTRGLSELCTVGLTMVLMPSLARAFGTKNIKSVQKIFLEATRYYVFLGVGLGFSGLILAEPVVKILYGDEFTGAIWVLSALLLISGIGLAGAAIGAFLSTTDRQDIRLKFSISVVSLHVVLAIWLVPRYTLLGAVYSSGISSAFALVLGFQWVVRNLELPIPYRLYFKLILSGVVAAGISLFLFSLTDLLFVQLISVILFALLYVFLTIKLNCWYRGDIDILMYVVGLLPAAVRDPLQKLLNRLKLQH